MSRRVALLGALSAMLVGFGPASAFMPTGSEKLPILAVEGPYGSPFAMGPQIRHVDDELGRAFQAALTASDALAPTRNEARATTGSTNAGPSRPWLDDERDEDVPAPPGTFKRTQTPIPGMQGKARIVAPHLTPDVAVPLNGHTTLGLYGEVSRPETDGPMAAARAEPDSRAGLVQSLKSRDVGAGFSLQYRFGN